MWLKTSSSHFRHSRFLPFSSLARASFPTVQDAQHSTDVFRHTRPDRASLPCRSIRISVWFYGQSAMKTQVVRKSLRFSGQRRQAEASEQERWHSRTHAKQNRQITAKYTASVRVLSNSRTDASTKVIFSGFLTRFCRINHIFVCTSYISREMRGWFDEKSLCKR